MKQQRNRLERREPCEKKIAPKRIIVFGGARGMGLWMAQFLCRHAQKVVIADPYQKTEAIAKKYGLGFVQLADDYPTRVLANKRVLDYDVALLAVPIDIVHQVACLAGPLLLPGSLLMDVTSLKKPAMHAMESAVKKGVGVLGTHPMFAPRIVNFFAQTCVVVPSSVSPPEQWLEWWESLVHEEDGVIVRSTADEHDEMMLTIQVLLHFTVMSFAAALQARNVDMNTLYKFKTPVWEVAIGLLARIFSGNLGLYYSIQQHPNGRMIRELFINTAEQLASKLAVGNREEFSAFFDATRTVVGQSNITAYSHTASTLFAMLATHRKRFFEAKGLVRCILNAESGKVHHGVVEEVTPETVILRTGKHYVTLSSKKAILLGPEEENTWKLQHLQRQKKSFSFFITDAASIDTYRALIAKRHGISAVHITDIYSGRGVPSGFKKVTVLVEAVCDSSGNVALKEVASMLRGLGCMYDLN